MKIADVYSHADGETFINNNHPGVIDELTEIIERISAEVCRLKEPKETERTRAERIGQTHFFSPPHFNVAFEWYLRQAGWDLHPRIRTNDPSREQGYREIDGIKDGVGLEIQFGKYSFLTYDIIAKMVIFRKLDLIDCGVEICLMASMLPHMSSGIGAFEQVVWDLMVRGESRQDTPVLVVGVEGQAFYNRRLNGEYISIAAMQKPTIQRNRRINLTPKKREKLRQIGILDE